MKKYRGLIINIVWCLFSLVVASFYMSACKETDMGILFSVNGDCSVQDIFAEYSDICSVSDIDNLFDNYYSAQVKSCTYSDENLLEEFEKNGAFGVVEKDGSFSSDARIIKRTDTYMADQWYLDEIGATECWENNINADGSGVVVAVIDTGVNYYHSDIRNNMWINYAEYYGRPGIDDDGNGIIDDVYGANFVDNNGDPIDNDAAGHGSHVAGIIAMTANNGGGRGIAYGARIMALKAGNNKGSFTMSDVIKAINYAVDMGADVINMSFGTYNDSEVMRTVLEKASQKCVLVAAAGNEGLPNNESSSEGAASAYPAAYPFVIGVMAEDEKGQVTSWSNYDVNPYTNDEYEIAAPGHNILSIAGDNKYVYMSGTSMAAPMVSAAAAVMYGTVDKNVVKDPVKYVAGAITRASTGQAVKTIDAAKSISYKSLNLKDSLNEAPRVDIQIGGIHFEDATGAVKFSDEYIFDSAGSKELYCGFVVDNTWSEAENVSVKVTSGNEAFVINTPTVAIGKINARTKLDVDCNIYDSVGVTFTGELGKTYVIPLRFEILRTESGSEEIISQNVIEKTITLGVADNTSFSNYSVTPAADNIKSAPTIPKVQAKSSYIKVSWDNLLQAEGYYIYRSSKKNSGYSKIADVKASGQLFYNDRKVAAGKKYYYKIKAYFSDGTSSEYSGISTCMWLGKVKGLKKDSNVIEWKKLSGALKYEIYYSGKKNGNYKKIAVTQKLKYSYKNKIKKKGYIKVRAMTEVNKQKVYGKFSKKVKI